MVDRETAVASDGALSPILEQANDAVVIFDEAGAVIFFNAAAERLWGLDRSAVLGGPAAALIPAASGAPAPAEMPIARGDGSTAWASLSLSRIDLGGRILHAAFVKDATEEEARRQELYLLSLVADETDRAVLITDARHVAVYCNRAFTELFGYRREEVVGRTPLRLMIGPHTDPRLLHRLRRLGQHPGGFTEEALSYDKSGREIWISATINPIRDADGALRHTVAVIADVTEARQTQVLQQRVLEALADDRPLVEIGNLICRGVEAISPGVICSILRVDAESRLRPLAGPSLPDHYSEALDGVPIGPDVGSCGTAAYCGEPVVVEDIATDPLWAPYRDLALPLGLRACWSSPIARKDGRVAGTFALYFREPRGPSAWHERVVAACVHLCALAIERHESKAHIAQLAYYDTLTGLPNRVLLGDKLNDVLETAAANDTGAAVLFLDIDNFKDVNDTLGHSAGDALLVEIAQRLQRQIRAGDTVSRLGGDEFVVVLADCPAQHASSVAERILAALAEPVRIDSMTLPISASIGISLYPADGLNREVLLKHADTAMYEAKNAGRGTHRFFSPEMNRLAHERLMLCAALGEALQQGLLELHYQPQIRAEDERLHGVEALARWTHPTLGEVPPARFIALAEESGLIEGICEWAISESFRQMADWHRRGVHVPGMAINLSPLNFRNPRLPQVIADALRAHALSPGLVTLEITEGVMMDDCPETAATVEAIAALGVHLSLDDFGTGYSSLSSITSLPIEEIKIDRSFMCKLGEDKNARAVASAVVRIGRSLGFTVVAEGVETEAQRRFLMGLKCHVMQGYLFAPAMPAAAFEAWLAARLAAEQRPQVA